MAYLYLLVVVFRVFGLLFISIVVIELWAVEAFCHSPVIIACLT
jgi:hypothetical protein